MFCAMSRYAHCETLRKTLRNIAVVKLQYSSTIQIENNPTFVQMLPVENKLEPATGRILLAEPFLNDGYFRRAVILLTEHNEKGSIGFMLNKPVDAQLHELVNDFPEYDGEVYLGGPVQRNQLFFVHRLGHLIEDSTPISDELWWNGNFEQIRELIATGQADSSQIRFFIGYSGWEPGQLDKEMQERSWYVTPGKIKLVFNPDAEALWVNTVKNMGKPFTIMANFPEDPSLN